MKTTTHIAFRAMLASAMIVPPAALFGQGALTPPGAPAPTMKTLSQIEPRTPISSAPFIISSSGSYYLTANLNVTSGVGISIAASNVTLDLEGFTISSTAPSATGAGIVIVGGFTDVTVVNGHIKGGVAYSGGVYAGSGFANGIYLTGSTPANIRVAGVSVSGCLTRGIFLNTSGSTLVESCTVQTVGSYGIVAASVLRSTVYECGGDAIFAIIASECSGNSTGSGSGVNAITANNCQGTSNAGGSGVNAITANNCEGEGGGSAAGLSADTANNCYGASSSGTGLYAGSTANTCYGNSFSGTGLSANTANNCYGTSSSGTGLFGYISIGSYGYSDTGAGLAAFIANSCDGNTFSVTHKYNMP